jgi:hypothetical protein
MNQTAIAAMENVHTAGAVADMSQSMPTVPGWLIGPVLRMARAVNPIVLRAAGRRRWRPGVSSAANYSSASIRSLARTGAGVAVMRAARTTVTTAASRLTRTADASSRPSVSETPSFNRRIFARTNGAVQMAGGVHGSASAGPAPVHPSRGSRRQPRGRAVWAAQGRTSAPRPETKQLMQRFARRPRVRQPMGRTGRCLPNDRREHGWTGGPSDVGR